MCPFMLKTIIGLENARLILLAQNINRVLKLNLTSLLSFSLDPNDSDKPKNCESAGEASQHPCCCMKRCMGMVTSRKSANLLRR